MAMLGLAGCPGFFQPRGSGTKPTAHFAFVANFQNATAGTISVFTVDQTTGALTSAGSANTGTTSTTNGPASLVTVSGKFLYSANDGGTVSAFSVNTTTGALTAVAGSPFAVGKNPNAIIADPTGKFLYVANSGTHDISAFSISSTTGALAAIQTLNVSSCLSTTCPVGLAMHPSGKFLYVALDTSGIAVFTINTSTGALTFAGALAPSSGGAIQSITVEKTGKFAYAADSVAGVAEFSIDQNSGNLTALPSSPVAAGTAPIVLIADPSGAHVYVANQTSNNVFSFVISTTGALSQIQGGSVAGGASPSGIVIDPSGKFVYVTNFGGGPDVSIYTIDSTGKLVTSSSANTGITTAQASSIAFL